MRDDRLDRFTIEEIRELVRGVWPDG